MTAELMITNVYANIASTSMAFVSGFFSTDIFNYILWFMAIGALFSTIIYFVKKFLSFR